MSARAREGPGPARRTARGASPVVRVVVAYATFSGLWILFSDYAMVWIFRDPEAIRVAATLKGWFFVAVTSALLYGAMRRLLGRPEPLATRAARAGRRLSWRLLVYLFAITSAAATLAARQALPIPFQERQFLIVFMFPVLLSAYLGGFGPAMVATGVVTAGLDFLFIQPLHRFAIAAPADFLHLSALAACGLVVSIGSERMHRARRRVEAERELEAVTLESIGDAVITTDTGGRVTFLNSMAEKLTGWGCREAVGQLLREVFHPCREDSRQPVEEPVWTCLDGGEASCLLLPSRDGGEVPIVGTAAPIRLASGTSLGVVLAFRDDTERRALVRALNEKLQAMRLLDAMADSSSDTIFAKDLQGRYLLFNRKAAADSGRAADEVLGKDDFSLFPAEEADRLRTEDRQVLQEERTLTVEEVLSTVKGSRIFLTTKQPLRDHGGRVIGLFGISRDITERHRAEAALREREASYRSLFENMMNSVARCRMIFEDGAPVDFEYLEVNPAFETVTGLRNPVGRRISELLPGYAARNRDSLEVFGRVAGTGRPERWDHYLADLDMWFSFSLYSPAPGEVVAVAENVSERKKAELALRQSEESLEQAQAIAHVGSWRLDLATGAMSWSRETCRILGVEPGREASFKGLKAAVHPDDREGFERAWTAALQSSALECEFRVEAGGRSAWVWAQVEIRRREDGQPASAFGTIQDITERRREETEKERLQAEFLQAQKMESIGRLAGGVAHDFNNMLQVIAGNAELALARIEENGPLRGEIQLIKRAAERSSDLTRQLLAFARRQAISPKVVDLNDGVANMLKMLSRLVSEDIKLVWSPGGGLWKTRIDPAQLDQILANLTVNARDAIEGVGTIFLRTGNEVLGEADCLGTLGAEPGAYVSLAVQDTGCGMGPDVLAHIFEPFFTTKASGKGTGLGLATVFGIARQNGGFVKVSSREGGGSTFTVFLPRLPEGSPDDLQEESPALRMGHGETILVVEDQEDLLTVSQAMLQSLGYTVLPVASPEGALAALGEHARIDLFLLDVVMPKMNGRDLAQRLAILRPGVPVLFMSGYTADVIADRGTLEEGLHLISKPFSLRELSVKVRERLDARG